MITVRSLPTRSGKMLGLGVHVKPRNNTSNAIVPSMLSGLGIAYRC